MFLARKINFPKWGTHPDLSAGEIQADAITADLRTFGNKLSVWRCGDAKPACGDIQEAALAMASTMDRANKFDLVWFDKGELELAGFIIKQTAGETSVPDLVSLHYDVCGLDFSRLGEIAFRVGTAIANGQYRQFRRKQMLDLVVDAAELGRVDTKLLKCTLSKEVQKATNERHKE